MVGVKLGMVGELRGVMLFVLSVRDGEDVAS